MSVFDNAFEHLCGADGQVPRISPVEVVAVAEKFYIGYVDWICLLQIYTTEERLVAYLKYRLAALASIRDRAPTLEEKNAMDPRVVRATHQELSQLLGSSREKVTRAISRLKKLGWVAAGRGYVEWLR